MSGLRQLFDAIRNALTWWITVAPWEQAIRVRLGKHVKLLGPGVHLKIPIADRIYRQSTRTRVSALPSQTITTKDSKTLTIAVNVGYRIRDLLRLYETLHHAEGTICNIVAGAVGSFVVSRTLAECDPVTLSEEVARAANLEHYGIGDLHVTVANFAAVRTFRLITGEGNHWSYGDRLDTSQEWQPPHGGVVG